MGSLPLRVTKITKSVGREAISGSWIYRIIVADYKSGGASNFSPIAVVTLDLLGKRLTARLPLRRIAVWSGPRNLSTALMRSFSSRADTVVVDEPFYASYLASSSLPHPGREEVIASQPADWRVVADRLSTGPSPSGRPVWYQKLMAHHMRPEMLGDWLDRLDHAFLIRHPGFVIRSYGRVTSGMGLDETGLPWQWRLFDYLRETRGVAPPVVDASQLRRAPQATLAALCEALGLEWDPAMLRWPAGPHPHDGVWGRHWYANTWDSTGFVATPEADAQPPRPDAEYLDEAIEIYQRLRGHALAVPDRSTDAR